MNDLQWTEARDWWLLRNDSRSGRDLIYTRLYKPTNRNYPVWSVRFVMETQDAYMQLDPTLSLEEAKDAAKVLSVARSKHDV